MNLYILTFFTLVNFKLRYIIYKKKLIFRICNNLWLVIVNIALALLSFSKGHVFP